MEQIETMLLAVAILQMCMMGAILYQQRQIHNLENDVQELLKK